MSPAPDFTPGYPSKGEKVSVAWQAAWDELEAEQVSRPELQLLMMEKAGCAWKTAHNLISKALRRRLLVVTERVAGESLLCRADVLREADPTHPALTRRRGVYPGA